MYFPLPMDQWHCHKKVKLSIFCYPFWEYIHIDIYTGHKTVSEGSSYLGLQAILPRCLWWNILGTKNFQTKLKPFTSGKDFLNCKRDPSFSHGPLISLLTTLAPPQKPSKKTNPKMEKSTSVSNKWNESPKMQVQSHLTS